MTGKKRIHLFLILLLIICFFVRIVFLKTGAITFAYDQGRDAFLVKEILSGDLKILGPSVSGYPGLYHGVFYYYLIAPMYFVSKGSPILVSVYLSFINTLTLLAIFYLTKILTDKIFPALIASTIFAFSFEMTQYASWLSNPSMGVWFVTLTYISLYLWTESKNSNTNTPALFTGIFLGFCIQSNFALLYHTLPVFIWLTLNRKKINTKQIIYSFLGLIISTSTMIISEVRFGFPALKNLPFIFTGGDNKLGFYDLTTLYLSNFGAILKNNIFPPLPFVGIAGGVAILLLAIYKSIHKNPHQKIYIFLMLWIFSLLPPAFLGGMNKPHIGVGIGVGLIILTAILFYDQFKSRVLIGIIVLAIIIGNLDQIHSENTKGQTIFAIQKTMILRNELDVIDFTYHNSEGQDFSINTLTSPLYINTTWSYLYNWYGFAKYKKLPFWKGKDQIGLPGNNLKDTENLKYHFLIMEDPEGIPKEYINYAIGENNVYSQLVKEEHFGNIIVQLRKYK